MVDDDCDTITQYDDIALHDITDPIGKEVSDANVNVDEIVPPVPPVTDYKEPYPNGFTDNTVVAIDPIN